MTVEIIIEGEFGDDDEAADALHDIAIGIGNGRYSCQCRTDDNPKVIVIRHDDGEA